MREVEADPVVVPEQPHVLGVPERGLVGASQAVEGAEVEAELREGLRELERRVGAQLSTLVEDGSLVKGLFGFLKAQEELDPLKVSERTERLLLTLRRIGGLEVGESSGINVFALMADNPGAATDSE